MSTDELIFGNAGDAGASGSDRFESVTSVDLSEQRHYDIKIGCAHTVTLRATDGEKATVRLMADTISDLERAFKVELDAQGRSFDIDIANTGVVADAVARKDLDVLIELPAAYSTGAELEMGATSVLHIAHDAPFAAATKGHLGKRTLRFTRNGEPAEAPTAEDAPLSIELAGARCELTIDSVS